MEMQATEQHKNQIILANNGQYFFTVKPFEITNALGAAIGTIDEYSITNNKGETYKLYKTKEGNWYDISDMISDEHKALLRDLKSAIDIKVRSA